MEKELLRIILKKFEEFRNERMENEFEPDLSLEKFMKWLSYDLNSRNR